MDIFRKIFVKTAISARQSCRLHRNMGKIHEIEILVLPPEPLKSQKKQFSQTFKGINYCENAKLTQIFVISTTGKVS